MIQIHLVEFYFLISTGGERHIESRIRSAVPRLSLFLRVCQNKNDHSEKLQIVTAKLKRAVSNSVSSNDTALSLAF